METRDELEPGLIFDAEIGRGAGVWWSGVFSLENRAAPVIQCSTFPGIIPVFGLFLFFSDWYGIGILRVWYLVCFD